MLVNSRPALDDNSIQLQQLFLYFCISLVVVVAVVVTAAAVVC